MIVLALETSGLPSPVAMMLNSLNVPMDWNDGMAMANWATTGREVASLDALLSSTYGWSLLAKIGLVGATGALGARPVARQRPAVRGAGWEGSTWRRTRAPVQQPRSATAAS